MSSYRNAIAEAVKALGWKKVLSEVLEIATVINSETVGQLAVHVNSGIVGDVYYQNVKVKVK